MNQTDSKISLPFKGSMLIGMSCLAGMGVYYMCSDDKKKERRPYRKEVLPVVQTVQEIQAVQNVSDEVPEIQAVQNVSDEVPEIQAVQNVSETINVETTSVVHVDDSEWFEISSDITII